jgi:hypothetical protein
MSPGLERAAAAARTSAARSRDSSEMASLTDDSCRNHAGTANAARQRESERVTDCEIERASVCV